MVVGGYGLAGAVAAIAARDAGSNVILLEKAPDSGGISLRSRGAICCSHEPEHALAYLKQTNAGRVPDEVVRALAQAMATAEGYVRELGPLADAEITTRLRGGNDPSNTARLSITRMHMPFRISMCTPFIRRRKGALGGRTCFAFCRST